MEKVAVCQSCGMPMATESLFGTNADGSKTEEYCTYCFKEGQFGNPNETLEEMIATCVPFMVEDHPELTPEKARLQLEAYLPTLGRWQKKKDL